MARLDGTVLFLLMLLLLFLSHMHVITILISLFFPILFQMIFQFSLSHPHPTICQIKPMAPPSLRFFPRCLLTTKKLATLVFLLDPRFKGSHLTIKKCLYFIQPHQNIILASNWSSSSNLSSIVHPQALSLAGLLSHGPKLHWAGKLREWCNRTPSAETLWGDWQWHITYTHL